MVIKNIIIRHKKIKIHECSPNLIKKLQYRLQKDIIYLYHDREVQWEFGDRSDTILKYTYQLSANEVVEIADYFDFLSRNLDLRYQNQHEIQLSQQEQKILIDFMRSDMNVSKVAKNLKMHRYRIYHIFDNIREKTKLDPRCFYDLEKLHRRLEILKYNKEKMRDSSSGNDP